MHGLTDTEYAIWQIVLTRDAERLELAERCRASGNPVERNPVYDEADND